MTSALTVTYGLKFHQQLLDRLDALTPYLLSRSDLAPRGKVSAQDKLRLALVKGVAALESEAASGLFDDNR